MAEKHPLGRVVVPVQFGEQVIVSILYNHDANPVHHRPDHAVQWMLGLLAAQGVGGTEAGLALAGPEERTYALGARLLALEDVVVMPGIVLAAICYERFVPPSESTASITTTFTYPLLVPTKGSVDVTVEAYAEPLPDTLHGRRVIIEAFAPGVMKAPVRVLRIEATVFPAGTAPEAIYDQIVAPQFAELSKMSGKLPGMPALTHGSAISPEDRRRFGRIVDPAGDTNGKARPISESAWQCKIPRVLTEVIDHLRNCEPYQAEVKAYYSGRTDEAERRTAIRRYVDKELKYKLLPESQKDARIEALAQLQQQLYARQHTVFDPRCFRENGIATKAGTSVLLDLSLAEMRLRRAVHRFYTGGRIKDTPVFMGEATIMAQPLITRELANFLCEINYSFDTLKLLEYK